LLIGLDRRFNPLEILYNEIDEDNVNVFHAMRCRKAWRNLAKLGEVITYEYYVNLIFFDSLVET